MKAALTVLFVLLAGGCSHGAGPRTNPKTILVIRHAEKPDGGDIHLSEAGKKRATALPACSKS